MIQFWPLHLLINNTPSLKTIGSKGKSPAWERPLNTARPSVKLTKKHRIATPKSWRGKVACNGQ